MRPTKRHLKVEKYVTPAEFDMWYERAMEMGFLYCASGPLVRSSYKAGEAFIENVLKQRRAKEAGVEGLAQAAALGAEKTSSV
jgi:lipoic acid synthetase